MNNDNGRLNISVGLDNSELRGNAAESKNILHSIGQTAQKEGETMDNTFNKLAKTIGGVFALSQIQAFAKQVVSLRGDIQSLEISFETLAGKTKGDELFKSIREFAVQTPMMVKDLAAGAQTMLAFNIETEKVMPMLQAIGDISMGDAQKFNSLTLAFSQMSATGKLMGQDLLQMINAGFNPLSVISEKTGKSIGELKEQMEAGKISTQMVTDAFIAATSEGGKFNGMLEKQSKGINGAISNLQGAIDDMMNDIGTSTEGVTVSLIDVATKLAKNYEQTGRIILGLIATYGTYRAALIAVTACKGWATAAEALHYNWLLLVERAQKMLNATMLSNPYVLVATLIAGVVAGLMSMKTETERVKEAEDAYEKKKQEVIEAEQQHRAEIDKLCEVAGDEATSTDLRKEALVKLIQQYPEVFKKYKTETEMLENIRDIKKEIAELDGKTSVTNTKNELAGVEKRIKELEKKAKDVSYVTYTTSYGAAYTQQVGGLTSAEEAELKMLRNKKTTLTKQSQKEDADAYFKDLTGISDEELAQRIQTRKNLLAKMKLGNYKNGKIVGEGDTSGTYTKEELEGQLQLLQTQKTYRDADSKSGKTWAEDKKKAYEKALKAYNDYVTGVTSKDVKEEDFKKKSAELKSAMEAAKKEYEKYKPATDSDAKSAATKAAQEQKRQNQTTVEIAERNKQIEEIKKAQIKANRDAELEARQDRLNLEKDSIDKTLQQIEIDKERMKNALEDREDELLEQYRNIMEKQWQNQHPKAKDEGLSFDRTSVTKEDMTAASTQEGNEWLVQAMAAIAESRSIMEKQSSKATADAYKSLIEDVKTYEQQRLEIQKQYKEKRDSLYEDDGQGGKKLRQGVTEGNVAELNRNETEALKAIDQQFASREETYQSWCEEIANLSLKQLEAVLEDAKKKLDELEKSGTATSKDLATARAKVNTAQAAVNKANAKNSTNPSKRSIKEWEDLYKTLKEVEQEFEDMGDTIGGTIGEIVSECGTFATATLTMINGIVTLTNSSAAGIEGTAKAGATAISTMEKASVILTIISAALQIAMAIVNLFNDDDKKQKEIDKLQDRIDQLQWELDNAEAVRSQKTLETGSYLNTVRQAIANTRIETIKAAQATNNWWAVWKAMTTRISKDNELLKKTVDEIASAYANMSYTADKALGSAKYDDAQAQLKNIAEQQVLIQEQIDQEKSKKKTDSDQITEWEEKIAELGQEALEIINDMVEDIIGDTSSGIAEELADAFIEAFQAGEDAAEAWGDKVNEIVADILKRMLIQKFLEEPLGDIFDEYKKKWFVNGQFQGLDAVIDSMEGFASDLNAVGQDFAEIWDNLPDSVKNMFEVTADREASSSGIATASQESVDELNGRATAIQSHTYSISENTKTLLATTQNILRSVMNIESETDGFKERMERMETSIKSINNNLDDIAVKGIKIKN
jgi:tape measure domain-containing protein